MASTPDETGSADAPTCGPRDPFDEARLLTIGQAADLLGVAHVTLRQWVRAGRIAMQPGRAGGLAVDLVRAGDLAALDPRVRQRGLPETSGVPLAAAASSGGPAWAAAAPRPLHPSATPAPAGGVTAAWANELALEVERLRAELAGERARGRARAREMETAERELRRLLAAPHPSTENPRREAAATGVLPVPVVPRAPVVQAAGEALVGRAPRRGVPLLALLPALVLGFVARPWLLAAAEPNAHASSAPATGEARTAATSVAPLPAVAPVSRVALPDSRVALPAIAAEVPASSGSPVASPSEASELTQPAAEAHVSAGGGDFKGRLSARELMPLAYAAVAGPACAFGGHSADLGPCMGPPTLTGEAVAGTHRVDGIDCCRHHQLAQRLGGDLAELAATAELARQEGVLPPLVAARIDRAVGQFLRARFGAWRAAGIDDARSEEHLVRLAAGGRATVETWIEREQEVPVGAAALAESAGPRLERRELRLVLEISDDAAGDVLLELVTLTCRAAAAAGGDPIESGADQSIVGTGR